MSPSPKEETLDSAHIVRVEPRAETVNTLHLAEIPNSGELAAPRVVPRASPASSLV
jgi:hypothetical protein